MMFKFEKKLSPLLTIIKRYYSHHKGSVMVEFTLIASVFTLVIMTIFELGTMMMIKDSLNESLTYGARLGIIGTDQGNLSQLESLITNKAGTMINTANLSLNIQSYTSFANASGGGGTTSSGGPGAIVTYQLQYNYSVVTPILRTIFGSTKVLTFSTVVKNEDF